MTSGPSESQSFEQLLDNFERCCQQGTAPAIESVLEGVPEPRRRALLEELVAIDAHHKVRLGTPVRPEDYLVRFPELKDVIAGLMPRAPGTVPAASALPTPALEAGMRLGPYLLECRLGAGGMGDVWQATHERLEKTVALKLLPPRMMRDPELISRFEREMKAVGRLNHPHVVQAYDGGVADGLHFLAMEYIDGQNLSEFVQSEGPLSVDRAVDLIRQAALGLSAAHRRGLVHRDIKPGNLMLSRDGQLKITDLGLARLQATLTTEEVGGTLTTHGQVLGTPDYMAPEQWDNTHAVDGRCDLYALGCTLFYLLIGKAPYATTGHSTLVAKMKAHIAAPIPDLASLLPHVPGPVSQIYERLLAKSPEDRVQTADELVEWIDQYLKGGELPTAAARITDADRQRYAFLTSQLESGGAAETYSGTSAAPSDSISVSGIGTSHFAATRQFVFLFTELQDSLELKSRLNSWKYVCQILEPHDQLFRQLLSDYSEAYEVKHHGNGFLAVFGDVRDAVACALRFHAALQSYDWQLDAPLTVRARVGIDVGNAVIKTVHGVPVDVYGPGVDVASAVMSAADGGRTLMTVSAFESASVSRILLEASLERAGIAGRSLKLLRHGGYRIQGISTPVELCEASLAAEEPSPPASNPPRIVNIADEGWLPEPEPGVINSEEVPDRPGWKLVRKLGEGAFGRAYLGVDASDASNQRVFKFCRSDDLVDALRNERELLQQIHHLKRHDIVPYLGAHLDRPPYFLEYIYVDGGNLFEWARSQGGLDRVDLTTRLEIFAGIAAAVAAANRQRVFHLDLKPSNILMDRDEQGRWQPRLTDFGIGVMLDEEKVSPVRSPSRRASDSSVDRTPRHLYVAPEVTGEGDSSHTQIDSASANFDARDVYALGVLLFQFAVGDLRRPLSPSAVRDVTPRVLRADIEEATHFDPRKRLATAAELEARVRNLRSRERRRFVVRSLVPACAILLLVCLATSAAAFVTYGMYRTTLKAKNEAIAAEAEARAARAEVENQYRDKLQAITGFWQDVDGDDDFDATRKLPSEVEQVQLLHEVRAWLLEQAERDLAELPVKGADLDNQIAYARLTLRISQLLDDEKLDARERRLQAGLKALRAVEKREPDHPALRLLLSDFQNQLAQVAYQRGNLDEAVAHFEVCLAIRRKLRDDSQKEGAAYPLPSWEYDRKYLSSLHNLALVQSSPRAAASHPTPVSARALSDEAAQFAAVIRLQEAFDGRLKLSETVDPPVPAIFRDLGSSQFVFGQLFLQRAEVDRAQGADDAVGEWVSEARSFFAQALASFQKAQSLEASSTNRQRVVEALRQLVDLELSHGNFPAAAEFRDGMVQQVALALPSLVRDLNARAYFTQAKFSLERYRAEQRPEDLPQAMADLRLAEHLYETLVRVEPGNVIFWGDLGAVQFDLALLLESSSPPAEQDVARQKLRMAIKSWETVRDLAPRQFERLYGEIFREAEERLLETFDGGATKTTSNL